MNLVQLYSQTAVKEHSRIKVLGDQVYIIDDDGDANLEFLIDTDRTLIPANSERKLKEDIRAIRRHLRI